MFAVWLFGVVFYATNMINHLGTSLAITGVLTNTWVLIILADYAICRRWLKPGRSEQVEFREGEVREWNPDRIVSIWGPARLRSPGGWGGQHPTTAPSRCAETFLTSSGRVVEADHPGQHVLSVGSSEGRVDVGKPESL